MCNDCGNELEVANPVEVIRCNPPKRITDRFEEFKSDMLNPEMSDFDIGEKWNLTFKEVRMLAQYYKLYVPDEVPIKEESKFGIAKKDTEIFVFM